MRKLLIVLTLLALMTAPVMAGPRIQLGFASSMVTGQPKFTPVFNGRIGVSDCLRVNEYGGAWYGIAWAKYGKSDEQKIIGGDGEVVYFFRRPGEVGKMKVFTLLGMNVTGVDYLQSLEVDWLTFLQATGGLGLYWDIQPNVAAWLAGKVEAGEDYTTAHVGIGLSIGL
jgi:hypothetical protein